jgi:IS6 family transposase
LKRKNHPLLNHPLWLVVSSTSYSQNLRRLTRKVQANILDGGPDNRVVLQKRCQSCKLGGILLMRGTCMMNASTPFKWRHFEAEIILLCVRWYLRYSLSYRDLEEMMRERGLHVDHTTIYRWVQHYAPELEKRCRPHLKATTDSWRVDETYVKVKKVWMYLYRAVDTQGNTLEFLLSPTRDAEAAKRFFSKTLGALHTVAPQVITVDKNAAYPKALKELQAEGAIADSCDLRQVKYLNNIVEQDHVSSNGWSNQGWASFRWRRRGEPCKAMKP